MDKFKVSSEELLTLYSKTTTLDKVFSDIERELKDEDQVVCQFIVNGIELNETDEARFSKLTLGEIETLEYLSENSASLIHEVIENWIMALPEMINKTEFLAQSVRETGARGKIKDVHDLVENCDFLISSVISLKSILGDMLASNLIDWEGHEKQNRKVLLEAFSALQKKDFVQFSYILEYDLLNCLEKWQEVLKIIQHQLAGDHFAKSKNSKLLKKNSLDNRKYSC